MPSSNSAKTSRGPRRFLAKVAAAVLLGCVFAVGWFVWPHLCAEFLVTRIETTTGDNLDEAIHELLHLGPVGIDRLVALLGAERTEVREAAFRAAVNKIDRRLRLGDIDGSAPLDRMAASLAASVSSFNREQLRLASRLAERLLSAADRKAPARRLRDCQVVMAADIRRRLSEQRMPENITHDELPLGPVGRGIDEIPLPPADSPAPDIVAEMSQPEPLDADLATKARPIQVHGMTVEHDATNREQSNIPVNKLTADDGNSEFRSKRQLPPEITTSTSSITASKVDPRVDRSQPNRAAAVRPADLSGLLDLDERLKSEDDAIASAAREERERENVSEAQLALALGAVDQDPEVREELVEALSYINTVGTRAWLLYLSHDDDANVRLAVVGRMAAGEHAEFQKRLAELADDDANERVRHQARVAIEGKKSR